MKKTTKALVIAISAALAAPLLPAATGTAPAAHAGGIHVRVGGHVRVHVGGGVRIRTRRWQRPRRVYYRPRRVYVGGFYSYRFASPPPPPPVYCDPPAPVYDDCCAPAPVVAMTVHRDPLPRLGLGITAGRFEAEDGRDADDFGVFGRLRLTNALELELETGKTTHDDGRRLDKRLGAGLYLDFAPFSNWAPYVVGAAGVSKTEFDGFESDRHYGEVGGGLRWRLTRSLTVAGDLRVGQSVVDDQNDDVIALSVAPPVDDQERYTRFSLKGILYF